MSIRHSPGKTPAPLCAVPSRLTWLTSSENFTFISHDIASLDQSLGIKICVCLRRPNAERPNPEKYRGQRTAATRRVAGPRTPDSDSIKDQARTTWPLYCCCLITTTGTTTIDIQRRNREPCGSLCSPHKNTGRRHKSS